MKTEIVIDRRLARPFILVDSLYAAGRYSLEDAFRNAGLFVIDNVAWHADISIIAQGLVPQRRAFKEPFIDADPLPKVRKEIERLIIHADTLFDNLYPSFSSIKMRTSFRPMITGPEPMHFDTYEGNTLVTAYINLSPKPRHYKIGASFPDLIERHPDLMRSVVKESKRSGKNVSYLLRKRSEQNEPPLDALSPKHDIRFAQGTIWFFDARTVSHEVVYGEGVLGLSWEVPDCGAPTQEDLLKALEK